MPNTIIKASAGSGKTFQLSNQFLKIILRADGGETSEKVGSILASTFTRKAAGEILDRILNRLAETALDEKKQKEFFQSFKDIPLPEKNKTALLQETIAEMAKNLYRLRICTLDAFFNRIASSFALELALPPGWTIIDEPEYQRSIHEAVREVFEESTKNEVLKLLHLLQKGEQDRNVSQELVGLAKDLLPLVRNTDAEQWDHTNKLEALTFGKMTDGTMQEILSPFLDDPAMRQSLLPQVADRKNKGEMKPDSRFETALNNFFDALQAQNWEKVLLNGLGKAILSGGNTYYKKPIESPLCDFLSPFLLHARGVWIETIIHQTKARRTLLELVWEKLESILQQKRGFRFEDITFCLGDLFRRKPNALPQKLLSHRMDAPTNHLLLDEFQDTSLPQWSILSPFVQSVNKSEATSFFCVGDLKQAIYGWRGGIAEIFESVRDFLEKEGADEPETPIMNETRRNSQPVIDAVNQVFLNIGTNAAVCDKSPAAAARWQEWFGKEKHETLSASKDQGYCVLEAAPTEESADSKGEEDDLDTENPFWKYTLNRIGQLHQRHPNRSIGILFRAGKNIPTLLQGLKKSGIEASDEGGVPLTDSAAVQYVLSVMTLIDHPGDTVARFHLTGGHLANSPLADVLRLWDYADDFEAEKTAQHWRDKLLTQGYGNTVKELMSALTPCEPKEMQRLEKLLELAYQFDNQATGTRTRQFIEAVNAARLVSPSADRIRVMTIHRAKGLEFDIVVLPDLDGRLVGMPPKVAISQDSPTEPINFVLRWVDQELRPFLPPHYQEAFVQWQDNQVKESLAVLYVAMTRARHELVMIVPEKSGKSTSTYAGVLREGLLVHHSLNDVDYVSHKGTKNTKKRTEIQTPLCPLCLCVRQKINKNNLGNSLLDGRQQTAGGGRLYEIGNENWDDETDVQKQELPSIAWNDLSDRALLRNLPRETPSGMEKKGGRQQAADGRWMETALESPTGISRHDAALRGTAIHACFATIRWFRENDSLHTSGSLCELTLKKVVELSLAGKRCNINSLEIVRDVQAMYEKPEVRKIFMRSSYPAEEEIDVEPERRFAMRWKDKLLRGSMDRLVIRRLGKEVVGLEIIDFKTDQPGSEPVEVFLEERTKIYAPQMEAYRQAVREMYPNVSDISAKLVFASVNRVVILE